MFTRSVVIFAVLLLFFALPASAEDITGRVVGISDGDTVTVLTEAKQPVKVRLAEIDTPESGQPYGSRAKQALSDLVYGKPVRVVVQDTDRYGRKVGRVYADSQDINAEMVRQGAAWVYRQYSRDSALLALEHEARTAQRGLWALPEAERTPPWQWRAAERAAPAKIEPALTRLWTGDNTLRVQDPGGRPRGVAAGLAHSPRQLGAGLRPHAVGPKPVIPGAHRLVRTEVGR